MKVLLVTIEGGGNIPPILNTIRRLRASEHEVYVLSEPWMKELANSVGAVLIPFTQHFTKTDRNQDILEDWKNPNNGFRNAIFGPARITALETSKAIKEFNIDLVIADVLQPAALIPAQAAGIPGVLLFHMPEYLPGANRPPGGLGLIPGTGILGRTRDRLMGTIFNVIFDKYLKNFNAIRKEYGLPPLKHIADLFHQADLRIIQTSKSFDIPIHPAPANVRYTGPVIDDPDWVSDWRNPFDEMDQRKLVVISFSTTFQNQRALIQQSIDALANLPVRGLVTIGPAMEGSEFVLPDNVKTVANASHDQLFPHAAMVITHAGHGTVMRALVHGLPLICIPMGRDQGDNAAKVQMKGLGFKLSSKAKARDIAKAIQGVLRDEKYASNAQAIGQIIQEDARKNNIVEELEILVQLNT